MQCLAMLLQYKSWANQILYNCISGLTDEQLTAPQPIIFGSLIRTLNHACLMNFAWKCNLTGVAHDIASRNPETCPDLQTLQREQESLDNWFIEYSRSLSEEKSTEILEFNFIGGEPGEMSCRDILLHVVNHTTYHRGHVADILYHFNITPPTTDLPIFIQQMNTGK